MTAQKNSEAVKKRNVIDVSQLPDEISNRAREIWLAGLGALSRLEEEGDKIFSTLVERGSEYEAKRRQQLSDAAGSIRKQQETLTKDVTQRFDDATKSVEKVVTDTLTGTLGRLGIPTRDEVRGLSHKVGELSKKLDALSKSLDAKTAKTAAAVEESVFHLVPHEDGWAVTQEGASEPLSVHDTKKEAMSAGRDVAKAHVPSQFIVHKQDRSVQETFSYDEDDA